MDQYSNSNSGPFWSGARLKPVIGLLIFLVSSAFVYLWIQVFLIFPLELPVNGIGLSNICHWQYSLSTDLVWSGSSAVPFWLLFHLSALVIAFRLLRKQQISGLFLEFAILNLGFVAAGTGLFLFTALANVILLAIPAGAGLLHGLLGCEPTFPSLPALVTMPIMTVVLTYSQVTGWLETRMAPPAPQLALPKLESDAARDAQGSPFVLYGGMLLLLLATILLHAWLVLFFTYAVQLPETGTWTCWGSGCEEAGWQNAISEYFAFSPGARLKPFLTVFHISLFIALFRSRQRDDRIHLPFEMGALGLLFVLAGMTVFTGTKAVLKVAVPPADAVAPAPMPGMTVSMPVLPNGAYTAGDGAGFLIMDAEDDLRPIFEKIPWEVNGRLRAWSGIIATSVMLMGLFLSLLTGWFSRLVRRLAQRHQHNLLLLMLLISGILLFAEFRVLGLYLLQQ